MTSSEIKSLRRRLGMNHNTFARFVGISFGGGSNVRAWEDDPQRAVPGNQTCIIMFMLRGIADAVEILNSDDVPGQRLAAIETLRSLLPENPNGKVPKT